MTSPLIFPGITPRPGGHEFIWKEDGIFLRLERLREHHDSITAEVWVEQGEAREHLIGGLRFNLTTTAGRSGIAKSLAARRNGVDWGGMMEQVCVYALKKFREQAQPVKLGYYPEDADIKFLLRPTIPEGVSTLLFGYGGMAKTTLALAWGLIVQLEEAKLGLVPKQEPIMLLDWETNQDIANRTLIALHAGMGFVGAMPEIIYRRCRRPLLEFIEDVKADVDREGIGLIILDSMGKACGGEKELKENALPTMSALEWLGKTNLIISHRPKGEEGKGRGTYGSIYVENDVRQAFRVEARHMPGEDALHVALFHTKYNLMSPLHPFGYQITWDKVKGTRIEREDVGGMADLQEQLKPETQIENALKEHARMIVKEIAEETTLTVDTVRNTLKRFNGQRFICLGGKPPVWVNLFKGAIPPEEQASLET